MKANYKNWMPKGMIRGALISTIVLCASACAVGVGTIIGKILLALTILSALMTIWMFLMYRAFSYNGTRQMSKQIIEGVSSYVKLDFGDETFDAVTSNYVYHNIPSKDRQAILLETLRTLKKGGTFAIHDIMSKSKYGDMESFANKLKDMGYEQVRLIDTTNGMFMSKWEASWMGLSGSTLLIGTK